MNPRIEQTTRRPALSSAGRLLFLLAALPTCTATPGDFTSPGDSAPPAPPTSQAVPIVADFRLFQPGVAIDWQRRAVRVDARVVLCSGPLEFLACFGGKEHESILRFEASATHIYMALGLIGLQPGRPPRWDETRQAYLPAEGDLVDLSIEYDEEGITRHVDGSDWLATCEYTRPPVARPWIFAGSKPGADGVLAADRTGEGVALVDMPGALLALSRGHVSRNDDLWVEAAPAAIPPLRTPVRVILTPARPRPHEIVIDFHGVIAIDGRTADSADLADVLLLERRLDPDRVQDIESNGTLRADLTRLTDFLTAQGVPPAAVRFRAAPVRVRSTSE